MSGAVVLPRLPSFQDRLSLLLRPHRAQSLARWALLGLPLFPLLEAQYSVQKLPSALLTRFISLEGDCANSYRFLRVVYLQGLFACALQWFLRNDADISLADWAAFFEMPAPKMVAYKAKYSHYIQPLWAAAFSIAVQGLCRDVFLSFFLSARIRRHDLL
ncbi:hypothetical protein BT96DRAFT_991853 [Gymnopus androsaceus JB14]|uniref:Uncharacterized protein n=1 Tax=Gymnopus androsaceus JB14 TaxID=1447944 RepID=A0A6A4HTF0_9AGAR|nr:hypothetical protein BT96DRAFT_991853 [Gymnopus androsaceus JB14]